MGVRRDVSRATFRRRLTAARVAAIMRTWREHLDLGTQVRAIVGIVYLVRHGQTAWNKARIFRGRADVRLDEQGRLEAVAAAGALRNVTLAHVYCSPLSRARETAKAIARLHQAPLEPVPAFTDIDYGDWTEFWDVEARRRFKDTYEVWETRPHLVKFPNGESLDNVRTRAYPRLVALARKHKRSTIAVVTHRVVIKALLCAVKELDNSHFWEIRLDTGAISTLELRNNGFKCVRINDTSHLDRISSRTSGVDF